MTAPFLQDPEFLEEERECALLSCINHRRWLQENRLQALERATVWLEYLEVIGARDTEYDLSVPILEADDEILRRDANRTFATEKNRDILVNLLYKCKRKFGDYQQSLSYMAGFLLLFYDS